MKAWVFVMAWMVVASGALAQDGFLPPMVNRYKKDGKLIRKPVDEEKQAKQQAAQEMEADRQNKEKVCGGRGEFRGHYYQGFRFKGITWHDAKKACEEMGGHLVTIDSAEENRAIFFTDKRMWLGGSDEGNTGKWAWVDNEMWRYRNWVTGDRMGKNDVKGLVKVMEERKRLISEAEAKKVELVAQAKAKADEYIQKADGKKDVYVERAKKKGEDLLWAANESGDRVVLEAKRDAGLAVLRETGVKIPPACVSSGRKLPDGQGEAPMTMDELKNAVKSIEGLITIDDSKTLNNKVGNYLYIGPSDEWNARFADGGWMAKGDVPEGMAIEGFVCEWDSKDAIKEGCGLLKGSEDGDDEKIVSPVDALRKKMETDPEFKAKSEAQKAEWEKRIAEEKASVSPTGKYKVTVVHPKTREPKTFECQAENAWDAKSKVLKGLNEKFEKAGKKGELMGCTCSVEFAE